MLSPTKPLSPTEYLSAVKGERTIQDWIEAKLSEVISTREEHLQRIIREFNAQEKENISNITKPSFEALTFNMTTFNPSLIDRHFNEEITCEGQAVFEFYTPLTNPNSKSKRYTVRFYVKVKFIASLDNDLNIVETNAFSFHKWNN